MLTKKPKSPNTPQIHFAEYRNLPTEGWRIKKNDHEWYSDDTNVVNVVRYHNRKQITQIYTHFHGSLTTQANRTRNKSRKTVDLPTIVKEYSFWKVGVDVGNQKLRTKVSYADFIRSKGWSRKWGIHAIQQCRHNAYCAGETYMVLQQEEKKDVRNGRRKEQVAQRLYGHSKLV